MALMAATDPEGAGSPPQNKGFSKGHDFVGTLSPTISPEATFQGDESSESNSTATDSPDEFNWGEDENSPGENAENIQAKRGRRLWLAFMKLARPIRVLSIGLLG